MHIESLLEAIRLVHSGFRRFPVRPSGYTLPSTSHRLTSRELDVLKLIVEGKRNKEIATKLGIKEKTVKSYISNVFDKMEVNHRTEAATAAIQRGLVHVF
jgi:DNA-binding NarL/FixJ family response regulator